MRYAQINEKSIVVGISELSGVVESNNLIPIPGGHTVTPGQKYESGSFLDVESGLVDSRAVIDVRSTPTDLNRRVTVAVGSDTTLDIDVLDPSGGALPITDTFAVPVRRIGGAVERTVGVSFIDGVATKTINWPNSGEFEITEDLLNMHLPPEQHFKFDRLVFSVYE